LQGRHYCQCDMEYFTFKMADPSSWNTYCSYDW